MRSKNRATTFSTLLRCLAAGVICGLAMVTGIACGGSKEVVVEDEPMSPEAQQMFDMQKQMFQQQTQGQMPPPQQAPAGQ